VIGGLGRQTGALATVERFDITAASWQPAPDLPIALDHAVAGAFGRDVIVAGGRYAEGNARAFVLSGGQWRELASLPVARAASAGVVLDGAFYVIGGIGRDTTLEGSRRVFAYDRATDRWREVAPLTVARQHLAAVVLAGRICALGGRGAGPSAECYDPRADRWEQIADLALAEEDFDAVAIDGRIWAFGPRGVQLFERDAWRVVRGIASPGFGGVAVADGTDVYLLAWSEGNVRVSLR
jgi:hypothetical protein